MDATALRSMPADRIESRLPDRPVASLRDIEVLYGELYTLGRGLTGAYGAYLTPDEAAEQIGDERLLVVRVDLRGGDARLSDPPVEKRMFSEDLVELVAHSKFEAARGVDHSITHQSGQTNGPEKQADHAAERLSRWPTEGAVVETATTHGDGWLIDELATLGSDESVLDTIRETVTGGLVREEGQLLVTVEFALDDGTVATTDLYRAGEDWHYPGEIEVLQEAMAARKTGKFSAKNAADDAEGEGTCFVFDTDETVYGVVDDPMKHYLSKQAEKFPRLDADQSWRTQGLSRDAATAAQNAATFLDACTVPAPGTSAYYLPYVNGTPSAEEGRKLYELLARQVAADEEGRSPIEGMYRNLREDLEQSRLNFYLVIVDKYQKDRWRLLASEPNATLNIPVDLTEAHLEVPKNGAVGPEGPLPERDNFPLLGADAVDELINVVSGVGYFAQTCLGRDTEDEPSSDDFRFRATAQVAGSVPLDAESLLSEYVARLAEEFAPDGDYPFPDAKVAEQYTQYNALARCGLLDADDEVLTKPARQMTDTTTSKQNRRETLNEFVQAHPVLRDNNVRQGIFCLGALVGRVTRYQRRQDTSATAVKQYPIGNLTKNNVTRIATEVTESNVVYSGEEGYSGTMFAELQDKVADGLLAAEPRSWSLSTDDLRFHYAMGIAYGLNDSSTSDYDE